MEAIITNGQNEVRVNIKRLKAAAGKVLRILNLPAEVSVSITFFSRRKIRSLNKRYFNKDSATDVISLGYKGKGKWRSDRARRRMPGQPYKGYLGDIIICPAVALENSKIYKNSFFSELTLYIIHGILHLLGYADTNRREKEKMQKKEKEILAKI